MSKIYTQKEAVKEGFTTTVAKYAKQTGWSQGHITVCIRRGDIPAVKVVAKGGGKPMWMLDLDRSKLWKKEGGRKIVQKKYAGQEVAGRYVFQPDQPSAMDLVDEALNAVEPVPMVEKPLPYVPCVLTPKKPYKDTVLDLISICKALLNTLQENLGE